MPRRLTLPALAVLSTVALAACSDDQEPAQAAPRLTATQVALVEQAGTAYADYVRAETARLLDGTRAFVTAYKAGQDDRARALYARTRMHWETIEPVAESFGDLDPRTDAREVDLESGRVPRVEDETEPAAEDMPEAALDEPALEPEERSEEDVSRELVERIAREVDEGRPG